MLACDARIIPAVLGGPSQVLDVGAASRSFPAAIRRAITLRDRGCTWPGCDRKPGWCDAHHIRPLGRTMDPPATQRLPALPVPSRRNPSRPLASPDGPRRHPRIHPTEMG